jgi:hypothetical protein
MFTITIDDADLVKMVDDMVEKLDQLYPEKIFVTFVQWQEDDMKRAYPHILPEPPDSVSTMVYPRSRLTARRQQAVGGKPQPKPRTGARQNRPLIVAHGAQRPLLRQELVDQLQGRLHEMLGDIKWE